MNIWILNVGENMPDDGENIRLLRCGILADILQKRGHTVTWWSSSYDHYLKRHRYHQDTDIQITQNYKIKYLHGLGYKSNVSLRRLIDHYVVGKKFAKKAKKETSPDLILTSFPIISLTYYGILYGLNKTIPVVVDARDMWPDIFVKAFPNRLQKYIKPLLYPLYKRTSFVFQHATAITGMTNSFVEWGLKHTKRNLTQNDIAFPFAYVQQETHQAKKIDNIQFLTKHNISTNKINIVIIAYIGSVINLDLILAIGKKLDKNKANCEIIVCGDGVLFDEFKEKAQDISSINLLGWCDAEEIAIIMEHAAAGFIPYKNREDFLISIPNKVPEYMSAGLPVITSLSGTVKEMVETNKCGYYIENENDFIKVIEEIALSPELYKEKVDKSLQYFNEFFKAEVVYNKMADYLEEIKKKNLIY